MESGCWGSSFIVGRHLRKFAIESIALCAPSYLNMTSHFKSIPTPSGSQPDVWHLLLIFRGGQKLTPPCCAWKCISVPILRSVYIIFKASNWTGVPLSTPAITCASLQSNLSQFALHPTWTWFHTLRAENTCAHLALIRRVQAKTDILALHLEA